nr:unnamed protein product [Callosobruchus chinensis]CAI5818917.1 unnamed protein product [Callosobruchus analis]CAH7726829.1 unnamed protein product [Callosobruchus chinensis]CAH7733976.1 unnamed protein product [Callosobruchus chinensis]CAH7741215.1 unnamed protein product [Callosobruchus chinensis]
MAAHSGDKYADIADALMSVTDDQAQFSDIGGDSDAEDGLVLQQPRFKNRAKNLRGTSDVPSTSTADNTDSDCESSDHGPPSSIDSFELYERYGTPAESDSNEDAALPTFEWSKEPGDPIIFMCSTFTEQTGPKCDQKLNNPIDFFSLFFTEFFLCEIVYQSNLYATQLGQDLSLGLDELKAFLGIIIYMGFHYLPGYKLYWSTDENFHCERIARIMTQKRFLKILRFLHLTDNSSMPDRQCSNYDRLYKVRPLLDYLGDAFKQNFGPSQFISIDESMVGFKGRSTLKQYMPLKPIKRGFKVWVMCCAVTGYVIAFDIYTGKDPTNDTSLGLGENVVLKLTRALEGLYYCLFFDNFFTSVPLVYKLLRKKMFACGTVRVNRKHLPVNVINDKSLKQHQTDFATSGDISFIRWIDRGKKPVTVLSSMHNPSSITTVRRTNAKGEKEEVPCPVAVSDYNKYMGGVDKMDQMIERYSVVRKSRRWWMKIFFYFIDVAICNSFVIYKSSVTANGKKPISHLVFRSILVNELIGTFSSKQKKGYQPMKGFAKKKRSVGVLNVQNTKRLSNVGIHLPEVIKTYRRCALCSTKRQEKRSNVLCSACNVALCKGCFADFHKSN